MLEKDDLEMINQMIHETLKPLKIELDKMGEKFQQKDFIVKDTLLTEQAKQDKETGLRLRAYDKLVKKAIGRETRKARVIFSKAGGSASKGSQTTRITLPIKWVREMGITEEAREVDITFQDGKIIIAKAMETDENGYEREEKEE